MSRPARRRKAPAHVRRAWEAWNLATLAWETSRESANGWSTEQADHDATYPAPRFRDYLEAECAELRHIAELAELQDAA